MVGEYIFEMGIVGGEGGRGFSGKRRAKVFWKIF